MPEDSVNVAALEPLFAPWEEPNRHRTRAERPDEPAVVQKGRRPSSIAIANNLRPALDEWRRNEYVGASDTSRELLNYWFLSDHRLVNGSGEPQEFHYYFCQREALEAFIYLLEVRNLCTLSEFTAEFGGANADLAAQGITPEEDLWPRYAFRVATGAGKTKIMSLAITWSYFHALRESNSPMAKNFLVIAPNLTVFERLKQDFGEGRIFDSDPLIPPGWKGDWNLSTVLQDEASGATTGGTLYLTNIHRLYEPRRANRAEAETYPWMGPAVSRGHALDTGDALRKRITSHPRLMVINDEAHHLWDPDSAWMEALSFLNDAYKARNGVGLTAQLDFSATPKDKDGNRFKHIVSDSPLGEAVDAGIVKVPIIGHVSKLQERADENAAYRYDEHLRLGYARWEKSNEEWKDSGKKPLMFVMCENTEAADQIAKRLNTDSVFKLLNGKTVNLHTNLKGKVKKIKRGGQEEYIFEPNEKEISDEDLKQLRKLSRDLDNSTSPYRCIVSVLMLREGWDVKNVTTIVPLRPYNAPANILPEQTLGRGLRRMTPNGQAIETVTVVEHSAFVKLYQDELSQEGLFLPDVPVDEVPRTTVSIFPDQQKDWNQLQIGIPTLTDAYRIVPLMEDISFEEVQKAARNLPPLSLGKVRPVELDFEGRSLITNEVVERMKISLPLLQDGIGAITFYREELETICKLRGIHPHVAPLLERYLTEELFGQKVSLFDQSLVARLGDPDVREYIRAVFVPLLRKKTTVTQERLPVGTELMLSGWKPFQVTSSEHHPALRAERTLFNLVPCNRNLEVLFTYFADMAEDVAAFAKNAGPQALRIDYQGAGNRHAFYTPDFFVRASSGKYYLVETKGEVEQEVFAKARAADAWCKSASSSGTEWEYLFVPEDIFKKFNDTSIVMLRDVCAPELARLLNVAENQQPALPFYQISQAEKENLRDQFIKPEDYQVLPENYQKMIDESVNLFNFLQDKKSNFSPCFTPLLPSWDQASKNLLVSLLQPEIPHLKEEQNRYFEPVYAMISERDAVWLKKNASGLKKALAYGSFIMPIGMLSFCLEFAQLDPPVRVGGVFESIRKKFGKFNQTKLFERVEHVRTFRNTYVAHQGENSQLTDVEQTQVELKNWITGLSAVHKATVANEE